MKSNVPLTHMNHVHVYEAYNYMYMYVYIISINWIPITCTNMDHAHTVFMFNCINEFKKKSPLNKHIHCIPSCLLVILILMIQCKSWHAFHSVILDKLTVGQISMYLPVSHVSLILMNLNPTWTLNHDHDDIHFIHVVYMYAKLLLISFQ